MSSTLSPKSGIAQPPFQPTAQQRHRQQNQQVKDHQQEQALGGFVVQANEVFRGEHQIHQADGAEHAGLLQQENDVGDERRHTDGHSLRQDDVAHRLRVVHAQAHGALGLNRLDGFQPAAERLRHVAAAQKRQTCNAADRSVSPDADLRQTIIDEKQLDQERRVAAELDVEADDAAQYRHLIILDQCADQPDDNSQRDTCQPQTQGQPRRFFKQRQVLCDHIPIHKSLPFPIGSRTNLGTKKSGPSLRRFPDKGQVQHMGVLVGPADHAR